MARDSHKSKIIAATVVILVVIAGIVSMIAFLQTRISTCPTIPRLPRHLTPTSYEIFLQPHLYTRITEVDNVTSTNQSMLFTGNSTVYFTCVQTTSTIYLHSADLLLSDPVVMDVNTKEIIYSSVDSCEDPNETVKIQLTDVLEEGGNYSLFLAFEGELTGMVYGLYICSYTEGDPAYEGDTKPKRFVAATTMESSSARKVFPCFDEPDMKAVFHLTVIHRRNTTALGNTEILDSSILDDEWKYTRFRPTPRMSTYLLAFTVSEFPSIPSQHERVEINIFARPEAIKAGHAQYAANITGRILTFYERRFGIDYPLKKLDQIALPDLGPGAMENWGLITYHEDQLLYEEGVSMPQDKAAIANIIAHELAHQWFGNLVTMKWWNELWLKEGFASYMTFFALDHVEPSFKLKDLAIMSELAAALGQDSLASSHPLSPPLEDVQTDSDISEMYDTISYSKGAVVLRMLADIIEQRVFDSAMRMYLWDLRYNSTDQNILWDYVQRAVDEDGGQTNVAMVMEKWTSQAGYPVITINTANGEVHQKHFQHNGSSDSSLWWHVPIRVMTDTSEPSLVWLDTSDRVRKDEFVSRNGEWILANVNCTGFYRVNYNAENWDALLTQLETNPQRIPLMNRGRIIDDAFTFARTKLVNWTLALNSTRFLRHETEFLPWLAAVSHLEYFILMFDRSEVFGPMQTYFRQQVTALYNSLRNYTDSNQVPDDLSQQNSQTLAIQVACSSGLPQCLTMVRKMFARWMENDTNIIHPNLRSVIYCQAVASGGKEEWEFAWKKLESTKELSEKERLREALACTKKIWLLNRYLGYTLNPEKIQVTDVAEVMYLIARNVAGQALVWNFVRAHWEHFEQTEGTYLLGSVTRRFSTQYELKELEQFAANYSLNGMQHIIEQTRANVEWVSENRDVIHKWFERETV